MILQRRVATTRYKRGFALLTSKYHLVCQEVVLILRRRVATTRYKRGSALLTSRYHLVCQEVALILRLLSTQPGRALGWWTFLETRKQLLFSAHILAVLAALVVLAAWKQIGHCAQIEKPARLICSQFD